MATALIMTPRVLTISVQAQVQKTRIVDRVTDASGNPRSGKVTFILTQKATGPSGLISVNGTVSATLDSSGRFNIQVYPSSTLTPAAYYQVWYTSGAGQTELLGIYNIPAVGLATISLAAYKVTDTNLAAQYTFASVTDVNALVTAVSTATLAHLNGVTRANGAIQLYKSSSGTFEDSSIKDNGSTVTVARPVSITGSQTVNGAQTVTGNQSVGGDQTVTGTSTANAFVGDGSGLTNVLPNSPTFSGTVTANAFVGNGAALTGVTGATGGIANTGSTTAGADTDSNGSGVLDLQTRTQTRLRVDNDGEIVLYGPLGGSDLPTVITAFGSTQRTLRIETALSLSADLTIPKTTTLTFGGQGKLTVASGKVLTLNCPIVAPARQIFAGAGTVAFGPLATTEIYPEWWGADPTDSSDDLAAILSAVASLPTTGGVLRFHQGTYKVSGTTILPSHVTLQGQPGATIDSSAISTGLDTFAIQGSDSSGAEGKDITIADLTMIDNAEQYEISIVGLTYTYAPHDITIRNITTSGSSLTGAFWLNQASYVYYQNCHNSGGVEHLGVASTDGATPEGGDPTLTHHIYVENCSSVATTQYGYQFVNAQECYISHTYSDGASQVAGDKTGITFDRIVGGAISFNHCVNSPIVNLYVTGSEDVNVIGNKTDGGGSGIIIAYNNESDYAPSINESYRITVVGNKVLDYNPILNGILISGVRDSTISNNTVASVGGADVNILVTDATRLGDSHAETSENNVVTGNICGGNIQFSSAAAQNVGMNQGTYTGNSFMLTVGNGVAGGVYWTNDAHMYRNENTGDLTISGGTVKLVNAIKLANSVSTSRIGKLTASLSPSAVGANTCAAQSFTVTGVSAGDVILVNKPSDQAGLSAPSARATGTNTVSINFCNNTASPITPTASETYLFTILQ